jgi:hypothetical protein
LTLTYSIHCQNDATCVLKMSDAEMNFANVLKAVEYVYALPGAGGASLVIYDRFGEPAVNRDLPARPCASPQRI